LQTAGVNALPQLPQNLCDNDAVRGWIFTLLAACTSASGVEIGGKCSLKNPCTAGAVCDMTDPSGPVCISATGDIDGDGIPNGMDFCEHAPGGRYDEDRDGIGDECDPCPIAPPPASPDPDGDAVDSPCDPDPLTPGDQILLFDGFNGDALDTRWKATTAAAWSVVGGEAIADLAAVPTEDYLSTTTAGAAHFALLVSYRVDQLETNTPTHLLAIAANDPRPAGVAQFECGITHSDVGTGSNVLDVQTNLNVGSTPTSAGFDPASLFELAAYSTAGNVGCTAIGDGAGLGATQAPITPDSLATAAIGARGVKARFQWVLVVGR
jgi:hypothetical protein